MDHVVLTQAVTRRKVADRIRQAPGNASILGHEAGPYAMTMEDLLSREAKQNGDQCESWQSRNNTIQNPSLEPGTREILKHRTYGRSVGTRTLEVLMIPWRTHPDVGPGSRASRGAKRAYPWLEWIPATSPATGLQHQKFSANPSPLHWAIAPTGQDLSKNNTLRIPSLSPPLPSHSSSLTSHHPPPATRFVACCRKELQHLPYSC